MEYQIKKTKLDFNETERNNILFRSNLYEVVQFLFIFQWYDVRVSEFEHDTTCGK